MTAGAGGVAQFRVWIGRCRAPASPERGAVDEGLVALEPAEPEPMAADLAAAYVEAFNRAALARGGRYWATARPVAVRYDGDPRPGERLG